MFSSVSDASLNRVGDIEDGVVHDRYGKVVGYVQHNDIYRGIFPNGQLVYSVDPRASAKPDGAAFYKLTPRLASSGYNIESIGFLKPMGSMYRVYRFIAPGQGKLIGFVDGDGNIYAAAGAACLLLL